MRHQRGVTLSGLLVSCVVIIFVALLGFKLFTPYTEYFSIKKTFKSIAANPEVKNGGKREMTQVWERYATIERITAINGNDIEVTKEGNTMELSASYTVKVPLFANLSLLIDFHPSLSNLLLLGGGSGHGFKHGPEVGRYAAARLFGATKEEPRFSLATKGETQHREVH